MNEVNETCSLCNKSSEQMLMLSCVHDPCINCAGSAYAEQVHIKNQSREIYICEICGEETLLDSPTIAQLESLASAVIKMPTKGSTPVKAPSNGTAFPQRKKDSQMASNSSLPATTPTKQAVYYCKDHSEEEISYYCFTCWSNICPECAIHGTHKAHEVQLIKKAIAQVKGEYLSVIGKVTDSQGSMTKLKDGFLRLIKDTNDRHVRERNMVTREFDLIRAALAAKQKEFLKELEDINKQNLTALTNFLETINANTEEASKLKRSIEIITKKDDVLILEGYRMISELEQSLLSLNKTADSLAGVALHMNVQFLQQQCREIVENVNQVKVNQKKEEIGVNGSALGALRTSGGGQ